MRPGLAAALVATIGMAGALDARAWIFHEHWRITESAVGRLPAPEHAELVAAWNDVRATSRQHLCADPVHAELGANGAPACITFSMLPAIAADHSCSPGELGRFFDEGGWLLRVVRIGAETERQLAAATDERQRIDAWNAMHLSMERADRDYTSRAISNDGHFPLARRFADLTPYLDDALKPSQKVNAASLYAIYHLAAVRAARAYAHADAASKDRAELARTMLTEEAFALHFLEDTFSAGHFVGAWGDNATKKGTHDLYSSHGIDAVTWDKVPYSAHGDAFLQPVDLERTGEAVRHSLEAVLATALGHEDPIPESIKEEADVATETLRVPEYDVCKASLVDFALPEPWIRDHVAPVWADTPMPSTPRDQTPPIRQRAEIGPFIAFQSGGSAYGMFGGYQSPVAGAPRAAFSMEASVGFGYGLEGITTSGGDGKFFLTAGVEAQSGQFDDFCSGQCEDDRSPGSTVPRVPPRVGFQLRIRMPFWLVPGDVLLAAPVLFFVSKRDLTKMGILAADGGLIPWQRVLPTAIGDFQFMVGREAAVTFFDLNDSVRYLAYAGADAQGQPIYNPTRVRSMQFDFPLVEYRPFRSFSEKVGTSLAAQLGVGFEIPFQVEPQRSDLRAPDLGDVFTIYARVFFDGRAYL